VHMRHGSGRRALVGVAQEHAWPKDAWPKGMRGLRGCVAKQHCIDICGWAVTGAFPNGRAAKDRYTDGGPHLRTVGYSGHWSVWPDLLMSTCDAACVPPWRGVPEVQRLTCCSSTAVDANCTAVQGSRVTSRVAGHISASLSGLQAALAVCCWTEARRIISCMRRSVRRGWGGGGGGGGVSGCW